MWRCPSKDWKWLWVVGFEQFEWRQPLRPLWGICHTSCLPKFGHQTLNCIIIRCTVPGKNHSCISAVSDELICGKVCLENFYPLLHSKSASWIHIGIKRISQACCLHHLKNMGKNVKHNFEIGCFFRTTLYMLERLISFNMITNKSEAKPMTKHTLCDCKCKLYKMKFK